MIPERFWKRVNKTPGLGPDGDCWEWTGTRSDAGYGRFYISARQTIMAHRFLYEALHGELPIHPRNGPDGQCVCHSCDNNPCVNPAHLFAGTHKENAEDRNAKGREAHPAGVANAAAVLSENEVREIRAAPGPHTAIAQRYGISRSLVGLIKRRERWRHLT